MKHHLVVLIIVWFAVLFSPHVYGQFEYVVPTLLITSSAEGNGMGGISGSLKTDNALAPLSNPAQLGMQSLRNYFSATTYIPKTNWAPQFHVDDLTYNASAINIGVNTKTIWNTPFSLSMGLGYSHTRMHFGVPEFIDEPVMAGWSYEESENITFAFGLEYGIRLGGGVSTKHVVANLGYSTFKPSAYDVGIMVDVPVTEILSIYMPLDQAGGIKFNPVLDVSLSYTKINIGDEVAGFYDPGEPPLPLPRTATIGFVPTVGLKRTSEDGDWEIISLTLAREADDLLIATTFDSSSIYPSFEYQGDFGNLQFFKNLFLSEIDENVLIRKGWQVNLGEVISIRGGSVFGFGFDYKTQGYGIRLGGILKGLQSMSKDLSARPWFSFLVDHVDLTYDHASESGDTPRAGTTYNSLNIVIR